MDDDAKDAALPEKSQSPSKGEKPTKAFSCLRCFERKVKCDKSHPCANCVKSNVECIFRIPSAPRRKKKRATEEVLLERLKRAEDLLRSKGMLNDSAAPRPDAPANDSSSPVLSSALPQQAIQQGLEARDSTAMLLPLTNMRDNFLHKSPLNEGKLIVSQGRSRFVDNNLWTSVSDEFAQAKDAIDDWSDESDSDGGGFGDESGDIVLGLTPTSGSGIAHLHPNPENVYKLWGIFLENINPMTKIIHKPSLEKQLIKACQDLENIPRGLECLMFAIYTCAVGSMQEEECEKTFGESRQALFSRYRTGCRRALAKAKFLGTGDLMVCQSFVLYVLIMREVLDARTVWTLSGVANRMAQGLGLHRDGTQLGLPVFETELRRRLWWQLTILDFRSAELTGSGRFGDFWNDTSAPRNVDDADFWPGITEREFEARIASKGEDRATEMVTCLLRCEFGAFWREKLIQKSKSNSAVLQVQLFGGKPPSPWDIGLKERDETISELERRLEDKFLRYCDVNVPLQFMACIIARGAVASMRLMAHHPRRWANEAEIPAEERRLLWTWSLKLLESDALCHSTKALQRYLWHTNVYFQWQALVYILGELKKRHVGEDVDTAWRKVEETYHHHPPFILEFRKPLHAAVGSLCLKAWDARMRGRAEAQEKGEMLLPIQTPEFIEMLREQRKAGPTKRKSTAGASSSQGVLSKVSSTTTPEVPGLVTTRTASSSGDVKVGSDSAQRYTEYTAKGFSGIPGQLDVDMSFDAMWKDSPRAPGSVHANNGGFSQTQQYGGGATGASDPSQQAQSFTFDPASMQQQMYYDPNIGLGPGMVGDGALYQMDMDWNQWDSLIQDYDLTHNYPGPGTGGRPI